MNSSKKYIKFFSSGYYFPSLFAQMKLRIFQQKRPFGRVLSQSCSGKILKNSQEHISKVVRFISVTDKIPKKAFQDFVYIFPK